MASPFESYFFIVRMLTELPSTNAKHHERNENGSLKLKIAQYERCGLWERRLFLISWRYGFQVWRVYSLYFLMKYILQYFNFENHERKTNDGDEGERSNRIIQRVLGIYLGNKLCPGHMWIAGLERGVGDKRERGACQVCTRCWCPFASLRGNTEESELLYGPGQDL